MHRITVTYCDNRAPDVAFISPADAAGHRPRLSVTSPGQPAFDVDLSNFASITVVAVDRSEVPPTSHAASDAVLL